MAVGNSGVVGFFGESAEVYEALGSENIFGVVVFLSKGMIPSMRLLKAEAFGRALVVKDVDELRLANHGDHRHVVVTRDGDEWEEVHVDAMRL